MYNLHEKCIFPCEWVAQTTTLLNSIAGSEYWLMQILPNFEYVKLYNQITQDQRSDVSESTKCLNYRIYKINLNDRGKNILAAVFCKFKYLISNVPI